jgi:hypothetical protein
MEPVSIALVTLGAAIVAAIAPIGSLIVTSWLRRKEKREDYARQDAVAEQAAKAADLLLAAQAKTSQQNTETQGKLNHISTLVNSNLTREMELRLQALYGQVMLTKEKLSHLEHGTESNIATRESLESLELVVSGLETLLRERGNSASRANKEQT